MTAKVSPYDDLFKTDYWLLNALALAWTSKCALTFEKTAYPEITSECCCLLLESRERVYFLKIDFEILTILEYVGCFHTCISEPQVLISFGTLISNGLLVLNANSVYGFIQKQRGQFK